MSRKFEMLILLILLHKINKISVSKKVFLAANVAKRFMRQPNP